MYKTILCDFNNIREGYRLAHRGKTNDQYVINFDMKKGYNLNKIKKALENKKWDDVFQYYQFKLYEPKERVVDALTFEGRIVQHVLCDNILKPYFEPRLIKENCACRINKGTDYSIKLLRQRLTSYLKYNDDGYVLKMDVKKFFPSIDRQVLKQLISDFPNKEILELLYYLIDTAPGSNGLPIGNQSSQWFALYYLNPIDRIIKEKYHIKYYVRYMDDLIIIHQDKEYLKRLLQELTDFANMYLKISFNTKTQIAPLHKGISFLGWKFYYTDTKKIIQKVNNEKRKIRIQHIKDIQHEADIEKRSERMLAMWECLSKGNTNTIRQHYGVFKPLVKKKQLSKMDEEKYLNGEIVGTIKKMSGVLTSKTGGYWGFLTIAANYNQRIKIKIFTEQINDIMNNYSVGNLIKVKGALRLDTYTGSNGNIYTDLLMEPISIEKLKDTKVSQNNIQLKY